MFKHLILALMLVALSASQSSAQDSRVTLQEEFVHYEFEADPDSNVREAMFAASPIAGFRGKFAARTHTKPHYRFWYDQSVLGCRISNIQVVVRAKYILPKWKNYKEADKVLRSEWDRFYAAVLKHERNHGRNRFNLIKRIVQDYKHFDKETSCNLAKQKFYDFGTQIIKSDRSDKDYDRRTRHGHTEGAYLAIPTKPLGLRIFDAIFERLPETLVRYLWLVFLLSVPLATFVAIRLTKRIFGLFSMRWA